MMRMTCKFYAIFMNKLIRAYYEAFVIVAEMKRGATATITKRCHGNVPVSGNSIEMPVQKEK